MLKKNATHQTRDTGVTIGVVHGVGYLQQTPPFQHELQ
jgi:hypothetical protein